LRRLRADSRRSARLGDDFDGVVGAARDRLDSLRLGVGTERGLAGSARLGATDRGRTVGRGAGWGATVRLRIEGLGAGVEGRLLRRDSNRLRSDERGSLVLGATLRERRLGAGVGTGRGAGWGATVRLRVE